LESIFDTGVISARTCSKSNGFRYRTSLPKQPAQSTGPENLLTAGQVIATPASSGGRLEEALVKPARIVCFGELLIRLSAPGREMLLQSPSLAVHFGGAEANVAVSLARLGLEAAMASVVSDNALGEAAIGELRRYGVDVGHVARGEGRMGLYFLTPGAIHRPSEVLYDRADSAFALAPADAISWRAALKGAAWLHVSGVTPAVSAAGAEAALNAVRAAHAAGVKVSMDSNYRARLWAARQDEPRPILAALMAEADLIFADPRDIELATGEHAGDGDETERREKAAAIAFAAFPKLERIAATARKVVNVDHNELSGLMFTRGGDWRTQAYTVSPIVDRIGGGDAFAAGLIYGIETGLSDQDMLDFAVAAACLKHSIPGDFSLASANDVRLFLSENRFDVRR
jgi:2-dehydro-3-deoxygluconokinase